MRKGLFAQLAAASSGNPRVINLEAVNYYILTSFLFIVAFHQM
jgi:hypothetical protein